MYGEIALFSGNGNPELAEEISAALAVPLCPADVFKFSNQMNSFSVSNESDLVVLLLLSYFGILGSK